MANDRDAEIFQIVGGKARQEVAVDRVVAEGRFVLPETEVFEPGRDVHARLHSVRWDNRLRLLLCKAGANSGMRVEQQASIRYFRVRLGPLFGGYRPFIGLILRRARGRFGTFAKPSANGRFFRNRDARIRREST